MLIGNLTRLSLSPDGGSKWDTVPLPGELRQIGAAAIDGEKNLWVGGREGVFVSSDGGASWTTPKNLFVNAVSSLYYDETTDRVTLTSGGSGTYNGYVFTVQLPQRTVTYTDAGWTLRFARPVGDHLVAATLFDGIVVQPKMIAAPVAARESASR